MAAGQEQQWVAIAGLGFTVAVAIVAGFRHASATAFQFGEQKAQLDRARADIAKLETEQKEGAEKGRASDTALALVQLTLQGFGEKLDEIGHDLKNMMTGKILPASRRRDGDQ